jgi:transcriptional regulator with XRE-family HTH domain
MATLEAYRAAEGLTLDALSTRLGIPYNTVLSYIYKGRAPSSKRAAQIQIRTGGAVTLADWFPGLEADVQKAEAAEATEAPDPRQVLIPMDGKAGAAAAEGGDE